MQRVLSELIIKFRDNLQDLTDSVWREIEVPQISNMINVAIGIRRSRQTYLIYKK